MYKNKVVVITGGSSGLGKALAQKFLAHGAHVALVARDNKKLAQVKADLAGTMTTAQKLEAYSCDVSDFNACERTVGDIALGLGTPSLLINSAGVLKEGYFDNLALTDFRNVMEINYFAVINFIRATLPYFNRSGGGRILNIASLAGKFGSFGLTAYCGSKFALVGLTEALRLELTPRNIAVQIACPGEFDTPMTQEVNTYRTAENRAITQTVPVLSLEQVTDEIFDGIFKNQYITIPGRVARALEWVNRTLPGTMRNHLDAKLKEIFVGPSV
jgi:3-dehydrosphinganine reductase